jgi:hypothetical protein
MAKVWEVWKIDAFEMTPDVEVRARIKELRDDFAAASGVEVRVMSGWYGEENQYVMLLEHSSHEAFGASAGKVFMDANLKKQQEARQKNPKVMFKSGGIWVEETL